MKFFKNLCVIIVSNRKRKVSLGELFRESFCAVMGCGPCSARAGSDVARKSGVVQTAAGAAIAPAHVAPNSVHPLLHVHIHLQLSSHSLITCRRTLGQQHGQGKGPHQHRGHRPRGLRWEAASTFHLILQLMNLGFRCDSRALHFDCISPDWVCLSVPFITSVCRQVHDHRTPDLQVRRHRQEDHREVREGGPGVWQGIDWD